jgi:hypothetical protein
MKLKFLIRLNALLLICSLAMNVLAKEGSMEMDIKQFTVKKMKNPQLKLTDKSSSKANQYVKCEVRTGILNYLAKKNEEKRELKFQPVFVQINKSSINLYESFNTETSLMAAISLNKLARIVEIYQGTYCLTFIMKNESGKEEEGSTLCPNNIVEKEEWVNSISEFKECGIRVEQGEVNENILMDFSKVNFLLSMRNKTSSTQASGAVGVSNQEDPLFGLYYDNSNKVRRPKPSTIIQNSEMKKEVKDILKEIQVGNLVEKQIQRQMLGKISSAEKIKQEVEQQKHIVREILQRRAEREKEAKEILFQKATQNKEIQLMKAVKMQIEKIKKEEIKETKETLRKQLEAIRGVTNKKIAGSLGRVIKQGKIDSLNDIANLSHLAGPKADKSLSKGILTGIGKDGEKIYAGGISSSTNFSPSISLPDSSSKSKSASASASRSNVDSFGRQFSKKDRKLEDYSVCYNKEDLLGKTTLLILGFVNNEAIKKICTRLYGESRADECSEKGNFCNMCCGYHIGRAFSDKLADCNLKCESVINDGDKKSPKNAEKNVIAKPSGKKPEGSDEKQKKLKASRKSKKPKKKTSSKTKVTQKMKNFFKD